MVIWKGEFKNDARRMTFPRAREPTKTSTRNVNLGWKAVGHGKNVKR
jgi:hypothetical protein